MSKLDIHSFKPHEKSSRNKNGMKLPTSADVARLAGVSVSAVSRTFTNGASVSQQTRAKVLEATKKLKYRPNQAARSLMTNKSYIIGLAVTHVNNQFYPEVIEKLSEELRKIGYRILLFVTHGSVDFDPGIDEILQYRVDGLILASTSLSSNLAEECRDAGIPVIMFNNIDPNSEIPSVSGDNYNGGKEIAHFLVDNGHKSFAFIKGAIDSSTSKLRLEGFKTGLLEHNFDCIIEKGNFIYDEASEATRRLLKLANPPEAIFCANDHMAIAALQIARNEFGLIPGKDISIVGFDNSKISSWSEFELTTFAQPVDAMVKHTIDILRRDLDEGTNISSQTIVRGNLIIRKSAIIRK